MRYIFLFYSLLNSVCSFALDYSNPPICDYASSLSPQTTPYLAAGEKLFLCIFVSAGPQKMHSLTFHIPLDTYSSLQLTGAYNLLGVPLNEGIENGYYMWAATPRKRLGTIELIDTTGMSKSFLHSRRANPLVAWPKECGYAEFQTDTTTPTTTSTTTVAPSSDSSSTTTTTPSPATVYTKEVITSCPFMIMTESYALPILSLVVNVEQGNVTSLVWDNRCMTCSSNSPECLKGYQGMEIVEESTTVYRMAPSAAAGEYLTGGCGSAHENCTASDTSATANACDPKVLVTFAGTDRNGNQLTSAGLRISQFAGLSISSLWDSVVYSFFPPDDTGEDTIDAADNDPNT